MKLINILWLIMVLSCFSSCETRTFTPVSQHSSAWQSVETVFSAARTERICENYATEVLNEKNQKSLAWCFTARLNASFREYFRLEEEYLRRARKEQIKLDRGMLTPEAENRTLQFDSKFTMFKAVDLLARRSSMSIGGYSIYIADVNPSMMRFQVKTAQGSRNPDDARHVDEAVLIPENGAWRIDAITYVWKAKDSSGKLKTYKESLDGRLNYGITLLKEALARPKSN